MGFAYLQEYSTHEHSQVARIGGQLCIYWAQLLWTLLSVLIAVIWAVVVIVTVYTYKARLLRLALTRRPPAVMNGSSHSPTAVHGAPSTPNGFSNGPATSSTASLSTQHLPPACGARQLSKLKRFLTTLQQFGSDISPEIGERVRTLVLGLVVSLQALRRLGSP
ncbi:hypothetical protein U0070_027529 [Myodes glareolus]|uniref:TAFH domain-containing protein n=1 Tax=Myodes glareolus TaxID=447135 RepID=A0AAW0HGZ2_MYOGA